MEPNLFALKVDLRGFRPGIPAYGKTTSSKKTLPFHVLIWHSRLSSVDIPNGDIYPNTPTCQRNCPKVDQAAAVLSPPSRSTGLLAALAFALPLAFALGNRPFIMALPAASPGIEQKP